MLRSNDEGATAIEYAILAALVAAGVSALISVLGLEVVAMFSAVADGWP